MGRDHARRTHHSTPLLDRRYVYGHHRAGTGVSRHWRHEVSRPCGAGNVRLPRQSAAAEWTFLSRARCAIFLGTWQWMVARRNGGAAALAAAEPSPARTNSATLHQDDGGVIEISGHGRHVAPVARSS